MNWIIGPVVGFARIDTEEAEPTECSGNGTTLNSCNCTKGLIHQQ